MQIDSNETAIETSPFRKSLESLKSCSFNNVEVPLKVEKRDGPFRCPFRSHIRKGVVAFREFVFKERTFHVRCLASILGCIRTKQIRENIRWFGWSKRPAAPSFRISEQLPRFESCYLAHLEPQSRWIVYTFLETLVCVEWQIKSVSNVNWKRIRWKVIE